MWGALIGAGAALLGGHRAQKNSNRQAALANDHEERRFQQARADRAADAAANSPSAIRKSFEEAGFNPLLGISPNANSTAGYAPTMGGGFTTAPDFMGSAMANAGSAIAEGFYQNSQQQIAKTQLEMENRRLEHLIEQTTLRPTVAGIYGDRNGTTGKSVRPVSNLPDKTGRSTSPFDGSRLPSDVADLASKPNSDGNSPSDFNENIVPRASFFGVNWVGSGNFSSGQTVEDAIGEGPLQWAVSPLIALDMVSNTLGNGARSGMRRLGVLPPDGVKPSEYFSLPDIQWPSGTTGRRVSMPPAQTQPAWRRTLDQFNSTPN